MARWLKVMFMFVMLFAFTFAVSGSIELMKSNSTDQKLYNFSTLNNFYRNLLKDARQHRPIDTVISPINVTKILLNDYDKDYLRNSCYESMSDILYAHGYNRTSVQLSSDEIQNILPAMLLPMVNLACNRQPPSAKFYSTSYVTIIGFSLIFTIKLIHLLTFSFVGDYCSSLTSVSLTKAFSNINDGNERDPSRMWRSRLWFGLAFNAFTCGLMLGTIVYHLIPNIFAIPNEDFDYMYLLRATMIFFGIYLFFIVEKLLRFRFNIDEFQFEETIAQDDDGTRKESDSTMIQMARMCGTLHISTEMIDHSRRCTSSPLKLPLHDVESDDEEYHNNDMSNDVVFKPDRDGSTDDQNKKHNESSSSRKLFLYHIINDFSNDFIYGCGLSSAFIHDRLIGFMLALMLFSEGFRRHSQMICQLGRRKAIFFLIMSLVFLAIGFGICIYLIDLDRRDLIRLPFLQHEYIYSILYGALLYTALVTLIPELNDFGQHLQMSLKQANQTKKQRRLMKTLIMLSQNLFLLTGVIISLVFACIWRFYHRIHIFDLVCKRDHFRLLCHEP